MYCCHNQPLYFIEPCSCQCFSNDLSGGPPMDYGSPSMDYGAPYGAPSEDYGPPQDFDDGLSYPSTDREVPSPVTRKQPKNEKKPRGGLVVDTSDFSVEERLIAAVWVHEKKRTKSSMTQIMNDFRQRFGRDPPAKNTLLVWERKLFSTGSVHDASRPGRPVNRRTKVEEVSASLRSAPAMSLRARAAALRVPRTTLRTILQRDLRHTPAKRKRAPKKNGKKSKAKVKSEAPSSASGAARPPYLRNVHS